jgi:hypothetical protein
MLRATLRQCIGAPVARTDAGRTASARLAVAVCIDTPRHIRTRRVVDARHRHSTSRRRGGRSRAAVVWLLVCLFARIADGQATSVPRESGPPACHSSCWLLRRRSAPSAPPKGRLGPPLPHLHRDWAHSSHCLHRDCAHQCHICTGTAPTPATSAPGLRPCPSPHLHQHWAHPCNICAGTGLTPATSAPGLGPPLPHLHRDCAPLRRTRSPHALPCAPALQ